MKTLLLANHTNKAHKPSCNICGKFFSTRGSAINHIKRVHARENNFECGTCCSIFTRASSLMNHIRHTHEFQNRNLKIFNCVVCSKNFAIKSSLDTHILKHNEEKLLKCEKCDKYYKWKTTLNNHIASVHDNSTENKKCQFCDKSFKLDTALKMHENTHKETFKCEACGRDFNNKNSLKRHIVLVHDKKRGFKCEICGRTFVFEYKLKKHRELTTPMNSSCKIIKTNSKMIEKEDAVAKIMEFRCNLCDILLPKEREMKDHFKEVHKAKSLNLRKNNIVKCVCKICQKACLNKGNFLAHYKRIHLKLKNHKCNFCDKAFTDKKDLTNHIERHENKKNYKCDLCNKTFNAKDGLATHQKINHKAESIKVNCNLCNKQFASLNTLRSHTKEKHELIKPFQCRPCNKSFTRNWLLKNHTKNIHEKNIKDKHDNDKPVKLYKCEICDNSLTTKFLLQTHIETIHENNEYVECNFCQTSLSVKCLRKHVENVCKLRPQL